MIIVKFSTLATVPDTNAHPPVPPIIIIVLFQHTIDKSTIQLLQKN